MSETAPSEPSDAGSPERISSGESPLRARSPVLPSPETSEPPPPRADPGLADGERLPIPGLLGALGWSLSALLLHVVGGFVGLVIVVSLATAEAKLTPGDLEQLAEDRDALGMLLGESPGTLLTAEMMTFGLGVLALTLYYHRANLRAALPLFAPDWKHVLIVLAWFLPLSITCSQLAVWADIGWNDFVSSVPELAAFEDFNTMQQVTQLRDHLSFGMMLLLVAVVPAIAEELLFRGIIGRGLLARYGIGGILLTTIFFSMVHLHPVHVVAIVPLSIAIHWGYLATRNLWIPILAHFLNNSWAVVALFLFHPEGERPELALMADDAFLPWWVTGAAMAASLTVGWLLWQTRTEYRTRSGDRWELPFLSTDRPAAVLECRRETLTASTAAFATGLSSLILFWGAFGTVMLREFGKI
jgi:uncharacterized protein